jgi:hypothetical protein
MAVKNEQKTVKTIYKRLTNEKGFDNFKPHWQLEFTDGTKAKLHLGQDNAEDLCAKLTEGSTYTFTLEDGVYNGKAWVKVCDVLGSHAPVKSQGNGQQTQKQGNAGEPLPGITMGNIINNATLLACARVQAGLCEGTQEAALKDLDFFSQYFEKQVRRGTFTF